MFLGISRLPVKMIQGILSSELCTQDETWVHHFDPESKNAEQTMEAPQLTPAKNFKTAHSAWKVKASDYTR